GVFIGMRLVRNFSRWKLNRLEFLLRVLGRLLNRLLFLLGRNDRQLGFERVVVCKSRKDRVDGSLGADGKRQETECSQQRAMKCDAEDDTVPTALSASGPGTTSTRLRFSKAGD